MAAKICRQKLSRGNDSGERCLMAGQDNQSGGVQIQCGNMTKVLPRNGMIRQGSLGEISHDIHDYLNISNSGDQLAGW